MLSSSKWWPKVCCWSDSGGPTGEIIERSFFLAAMLAKVDWKTATSEYESRKRREILLNRVKYFAVAALMLLVPLLFQEPRNEDERLADWPFVYNGASAVEVSKKDQSLATNGKRNVSKEANWQRPGCFQVGEYSKCLIMCIYEHN